MLLGILLDRRRLDKLTPIIVAITARTAPTHASDLLGLGVQILVVQIKRISGTNAMRVMIAPS
jgi:hypothetical protein